MDEGVGAFPIKPSCATSEHTIMNESRQADLTYLNL